MIDNYSLVQKCLVIILFSDGFHKSQVVLEHERDCECYIAD